MPRKKKPIEWTTEEAMKHLFPKKVRDELHKIAHQGEQTIETKEKADSSHEESN